MSNITAHDFHLTLTGRQILGTAEHINTFHKYIVLRLTKKYEKKYSYRTIIISDIANIRPSIQRLT